MTTANDVVWGDDVCAAGDTLAYDILRSDDVDTRRELYYEISRLPRGHRLDFLRWAAEEYNRCLRGRDVVRKGDVVIKVRETSSDGEAEVFWDVCLLLAQGLSIEVVMRELVRRRKHLS